ncbi:MAG: hypothetical protein AAF415_18250 [Pseudomonadota bacterium]
MPYTRKVFRDFRKELHQAVVSDPKAAQLDMVGIYNHYRTRAKPSDLKELYAIFLAIREESLFLAKAPALNFWLLFLERFSQSFYSADDKLYLFCCLREHAVELSELSNYEFVLNEIEQLHESTRDALSAHAFAEQSAALDGMRAVCP